MTRTRIEMRARHAEVRALHEQGVCPKKIAALMNIKSLSHVYLILRCNPGDKLRPERL